MGTFRRCAAAWVCVCVLAGAVMTETAGAHSNNLNGLVLTDARYALEKGDVMPLLKWAKGSEQEMTAAFDNALSSRKKHPGQQEASDMSFYATVLTIHRRCYAYKGCAPFSGIQREEEVQTITRMADEVFSTGNIDGIIAYLTGSLKLPEHAVTGIRERYAVAAKKAGRKDDSLAEGQAFVDTYLEFSHYVEKLTFGTVLDPQKEQK